MQAGPMRHRIVIQQPSSQRTALGQVSNTSWSTVLCVYSHIEDLAGKQVYAVGAGFTSEITHRITIRYTSTPITSAMRVLFMGRTFQVQYVSNPEETREKLMLLCQEQDK